MKPMKLKSITLTVRDFRLVMSTETLKGGLDESVLSLTRTHTDSEVPGSDESCAGAIVVLCKLSCAANQSVLVNRKTARF